MLDWDNVRLFLCLTRSQNLAAAATKLGIDQTTLARRMRKFEVQVGSQLFERNTLGYTLTEQGQLLIEHAEIIEAKLLQATDELGGRNGALTGQVRIGATEGLGSVILAPHLAYFCNRHPDITVDLVTVPRFVNLPKRQADFAVIIERPETGNYVVTKLTDYRLKLYATPSYLAAHKPIRKLEDIKHHRFVSYLEDIGLSEELNYMKKLAPQSARSIRSSSVIAQYSAVCHGFSLGILPCFMAQQTDTLIPVLDREIDLVRTFWLVSPPELRHTARVSAVWNYFREVMEGNHAYMMGQAKTLNWYP